MKQRNYTKKAEKTEKERTQIKIKTKTKVNHNNIHHYIKTTTNAPLKVFE